MDEENKRVIPQQDTKTEKAAKREVRVDPGFFASPEPVTPSPVEPQSNQSDDQ